MKGLYPYRFGAAAFMQQARQAETFARIYHEKMIAAGYQHDGMDEFTVPAGTRLSDIRRLVDEAIDETIKQQKGEAS